jgi:hypothetical protein
VDNSKKGSDFFEEEGKELLGESRAVKYLDKDLVLFDTLLHLIALWGAIEEQTYIFLVIADLPILLGNGLALLDRWACWNEAHRGRLYTVYQYVLILTFMCSMALVGAHLTSILALDVRTFWTFALILTGFLQTIWAYRLWKANRYILFITA